MHFLNDYIFSDSVALGGNVLVTIVGSGLGSDDSMSVTVCGVPCQDIVGTPTEATCRVPPAGMFFHS